MQRIPVLTKDGSHTLSIPELNVTYHSVHGAIRESLHVFIEAGLRHSGIFDYTGQHHILEMGLGTGLNALLTLQEAEKHRTRIYYTALELYPLEEPEWSPLNYCEQLNRPQDQPLFEKIHRSPWEEMTEITDLFRLTKLRRSLTEFTSDELYSVVYFDAFAPTAQPELWTREVFEKLYALMREDGLLVTYCSKSIVRRALQDAGFTVEKIPGPPGKREMVRAKKAASN